MLKNKSYLLIIILVFITLNIYLFASAPAPLPERKNKIPRLISVNQAFAILARENDAARSLYTDKIVGAGQRAGMEFREDWKERSVEAGPLPALFLRGTARFLEKHPLPLSLFLGSDFPISTANKFKGVQEKYFEQMKKDKQPKFFFDDKTGMYTAMFPDMASVQTCVSCHNKHPASPKKDWQIGDMMGATTWTFPEDSVTVEEIMDMVTAYRSGAKSTYNDLLKEVNDFKVKQKPLIGTYWPERGYYLPTADVFMDSVNAKISPLTFRYLLVDIK
jgi:adenylate cyclase